MLTVEIDPTEVEERLRAGELACPGCAGVLAGWGCARARTVRGADGVVRVVPRRSRCTGCRATHVLLPVLLLVRRADTAAVIGAALAAKAAGDGHRRIAERLGRPPGTVRGWLRCFAGRVERARVVFTLRCRALAADPVLPGPAGSVWADAVVAVRAAVARHPECYELVLRTLAGDPALPVRLGVAWNPSCPADLVRQLAEAPEPGLRKEVAGRPDCPEDVQLRLLADEDREVVEVLARTSRSAAVVAELANLVGGPAPTDDVAADAAPAAGVASGG